MPAATTTPLGDSKVLDAEVMADAVDDVGDDDLGFDQVIVDAEGFGAFFVALLAERG